MENLENLNKLTKAQLIAKIGFAYTELDSALEKAKQSSANYANGNPMSSSDKLAYEIGHITGSIKTAKLYLTF